MDYIWDQACPSKKYRNCMEIAIWNLVSNATENIWEILELWEGMERSTIRDRKGIIILEDNAKIVVVICKIQSSILVKNYQANSYNQPTTTPTLLISVSV